MRIFLRGMITRLVGCVTLCVILGIVFSVMWAGLTHYPRSANVFLYTLLGIVIVARLGHAWRRWKEGENERAYARARMGKPF